MSTTYFQNKDGSMSSFRTTIGSGKNKMSLTNYFNSTNGGMTFHSGGMTTRFNNQGQVIGTGFKTERKMTYLGSKGQFSDRITPFQ